MNINLQSLTTKSPWKILVQRNWNHSIWPRARILISHPLCATLLATAFLIRIYCYWRALNYNPSSIPARVVRLPNPGGFLRVVRLKHDCIIRRGVLVGVSVLQLKNWMNGSRGRNRLFLLFRAWRLFVLVYLRVVEVWFFLRLYLGFMCRFLIFPMIYWWDPEF